MHGKMRINDVRAGDRVKRDRCTRDSSAKASLKVDLDPKAKPRENSMTDEAQKPLKASCCCGSKSPKR